MKNLFLLAFGTALLFSLTFCRNTPLPEGHSKVSDGMPIPDANNPAQPAAALPMGKIDSAVGFAGSDRAAWSPLTATSEEFIYQHYRVKISREPNTPGEKIVVARDNGRTDFTIPMPENGYFKGICRNKMFVDAGTGPDGRRFYVFDLDNQTQYFDSPYCGDPQVVGADRLHFLIPVEESTVTRIPDCPQKEEWVKNGLKVGYGQRAIFNFMKRSLTEKSEWACVPMQ